MIATASERLARYVVVVRHSSLNGETITAAKTWAPDILGLGEVGCTAEV